MTTLYREPRASIVGDATMLEIAKPDDNIVLITFQRDTAGHISDDGVVTLSIVDGDGKRATEIDLTDSTGEWLGAHGQISREVSYGVSKTCK